MNKILVAGVGALGTAAVAFTLGGGIASADDGVVGQTYADAKAALSQQGMSPVVASTVGDRKDWDNCIVTSATPPASGIDGFGNQASRKMNVNLNCYAKYSTGQWPGFSLQSPEGGQKIYQPTWQQRSSARPKRRPRRSSPRTINWPSRAASKHPPF